MTRDHQRLLGDRLRAIRNQQGLTLQDVEERSAGDWKAVVIGSYERGDRAVSVAKLAKLADFYGVPMRDLLPAAESDAATGGPDQDRRVIVDLTRLPQGEDHAALAALSRYARDIQQQRGDYNGRMLSLRSDDIKALATAFGHDPEELIVELRDRDAIFDPARA